MSDVDKVISEDLTWLARFLKKTFKLTRAEIKRKILERVEVTV